MSKKKLQIEGILNELEGASLFFPRSVSPPLPSTPEPTPKPEPDPQIDVQSPVETVEPAVAPEPTPVLEVETPKVYNEQNSSNASKLASKHIQKNNDLVKTIRKTVRQVGKEVLFVRLSPDEKKAVGSIVYSFNEIYRGEGRKTSENEIGRIGLNYLLEDYRQNGNNSILAQVLAALAA
jgi:hypothetical protein